MPLKIVNPQSVHSTAGVGYSHVSIVGNTVYIAGQIALDIDGKLIGKGNAELQIEQAYRNLQNILRELGGDLRSVVKLTTYLTDRSSLETFRLVRNRFFVEPFPPNTLLFIDGLAHPDYLVEIEAVAVIENLRV